MEIYVISVCRKQFYQLKTVDITKSTKIEISKRTDNSFSVKGPFKGPFVGPLFLSNPTRQGIYLIGKDAKRDKMMNKYKRREKDLY